MSSRAQYHDRRTNQIYGEDTAAQVLLLDSVEDAHFLHRALLYKLNVMLSRSPSSRGVYQPPP